MGLPTITVEFKKLASTAPARSARGVMAVILQDATEATWTHQSYVTADEVKKAEFTAENYAALLRAFAAGPTKVIAVRVGAEGSITDATKILDNLAYNWVCAVPDTFQAGLVTYVKGVNTPRRVRKAKALVAGQDTADDMHIVSVANKTVTLSGASDPTNIGEYLPRLCGVLAACPMDRSVTFQELDDLAAVDVVADVDTAIDKGKFCLIQDDDKIRIARGVNTLQTISGDLTEDMKKIAIVEAMDLIQEDIIRTFKTYYLGKVKNSADNQALLVGDIFTYLNELAKEDVVDRNQAITVAIDVAAMRNAWRADGVHVEDLSDAQVKKKTYKAAVFVVASAHILDAMEDMTIAITMA